MSLKKAKWTVRVLVGLVLGVGFLLALHTEGRVLRKDCGPFLLWVVAPAVLVEMLRRRTSVRDQRSMRWFTPLLVLVAAMFLYLISSSVTHRWFFFVSWFPHILKPMRTDVARLVLLACLLTPFFVGRVRALWLLVAALMLGAQAYCLWTLIRTTGGLALYRTDHPSFMFRLWEFTQTFPQFVNYNPFWNAGTLHVVSTTSGASGPGLLLFPFLKAWPVHEVYTYGIGAIFIVLVPWICAASVRAMGGDKVAAFVGGVLGLGISRHFFLWMLHFGTIGASLSSAMILPVAALTFRVVWLRRTEWWVFPALALAACFLMLWPAGAVAGAAVALALLVNCRRWTKRMWLTLLGCGALALAMYGRTLFVVLTEGSDVVQYVMKPAGTAAAPLAWLNEASLQRGWARLAGHFREASPLLLFLGVGGAFVTKRRSLRWWFVPIFVTLGLVAAWGPEWKPNFQLSRAGIPLFFVSIGPASILVSRLLRACDLRLAVVRAALFALLVLSAYNIKRIYANEGIAPYQVLRAPIPELTDWIRNETPADGRIMFAGACVHAYGWGNVAYLPVMAEREMMADDYYGFPAGTIEYNYPPRRFRASPEMMQLFMESYNVTHVLTYRDNWKQYFREHADTFREELSFTCVSHEITVFTVLRPSSKFLEGEGRLSADFNRIDIELDAPQERLVLAYNWIDGLHSPEGVELFPVVRDEEITLIGVRPGARLWFSIRF